MTQNNCKLIGITGGIGTGKSTVSSYLTEKGYRVIDADKIAREVVEIGKPAYNEIIDTFGMRILLEDKNINRKKLGRLIFSSKSLRSVLNNIVHPYVFENIKSKIDEHCKGNKVLFVDAPLLIEELNTGIQYGIKYDEIWLIYTNETTQLNRLMERDKITKSEALNKINSQMKLEEKMKLASRIIDNSGEISSLKEKLNEILSKL